MSRRVHLSRACRKTRRRTVLFLSLLPLLGAGRSEKTDWYQEADLTFLRRFSIALSNPADMDRPDAQVVTDARTLAQSDPLFRPHLCMVVDPDRWPIAHQADDLDSDGSPGQIAFQADFKPGETRRINVYFLPEPPFDRRFAPPPNFALRRQAGRRTIAVSHDIPPAGFHGDRNYPPLLKRDRDGLIRYRFLAFCNAESHPLPDQVTLEKYLAEHTLKEDSSILAQSLEIETRLGPWI